MSQVFIFFKNPPPMIFMIKENKYKIKYYNATLFILFDTFNPNIHLFSPIQRMKPVTFFLLLGIKRKVFLKGGGRRRNMIVLTENPNQLYACLMKPASMYGN